MAKLKLSEIDMGLGAVPKADPMHDAQTLLHRSLGTDSGDYRALPLAQITLNPQNDYAGADTDDDIRELADDIVRNGLLHNIVVSDRTREGGGYMILSGERRYKAMSLLYKEKKENRYALITAKVLSGLDALDEMLVLDAANLQTRGGMQDEKRFRKATLRFIENLKQKGGVSERDAVTLATRYTGVSEKLIDKNITVETQLDPAILSLLDRELIPKNQAVQYAKLPRETQTLIAENLLFAHEAGNAALKDANDKLAVAAKTISELHARLETGERGMREVDEEISGAQLSLAALNAMAENAATDEVSGEELSRQIETVRATLGTLETQKKMYASTINGARAALKKSEDTLARIKSETQASMTTDEAAEAEPTAPIKTEAVGNALRTDIAAMVNKTMKKAESGVSALSSRTAVNRLLKLDEQGKRVMLDRMYDMRNALTEAIAALENAVRSEGTITADGEKAPSPAAVHSEGDGEYVPIELDEETV